MIPAVSLVVFLAALTALGDVQRPTEGHQIGNGTDSGFDIVFPVSIAQCEPVIIYYNMTDSNYVVFGTPDIHSFLNLWFPAGVGYLDWICDIPAGYSLLVHGYNLINRYQYYTVQPGSSSACLGDLTTTYEYASYSTSNFQSYTQDSPSGNPSYSAEEQLRTIDFPIGSFSTITVNPNLAVTSPAVSSTSSSPPTSSTPVSSLAFPSPAASSPASAHKSKKAAIAGGIIGGAAFVLLALVLLFIFHRKYAKLHSDATTTESLAVELEPKAYSGLMTSQPGLAYISAQLPSSDRERHFPHIDSTDAVRRESEFTPNIAEAAGTAIHDVPFATLPGNISTSVPPVPPKPENIILSYHPPQQLRSESRNPGSGLAFALDATRGLTASERQSLIASLNASTDPAAPEAPTPLISSPVPRSSASIAPPVPPKLENIVLSYHPPERSVNESSGNPATGLASLLDAARGLTASEQQALIASLNASTDPAPPEASSQPAPPELSTSLATQQDLPDIANILGVIARARLSTMERHAVVASLNNLLTPDQATPGGLTRENTVSSPPRYAD